MLVAIAGGHGKIARRLTRLLVAHGEQVRGLIRNPDHAADLRADGGEPAVCDVEHASVAEIARAIAGADAVVFAAGAGPGSGPERKWTVDRDGAIKLLEAARGARVERYLMISSAGAEDPPDRDDVFSVYLRAKAQADAALMASDRAWERALQALLTFVVGAYIVLFPGGGAISLTLLLVVWFVGTGGLQLVAARRLWGLPGAGIVLFNGVLSILLAVLIVANLPSSAAWAIGLLVGINLVFLGIRALLAAGMLKRASAA
jgi:putative NADH-flavin reductase